MKSNKKNVKVEKNPSVNHAQIEENMILARLALPINKRTGFLRKRLKNGGSFI